MIHLNSLASINVICKLMACQVSSDGRNGTWNSPRLDGACALSVAGEARDVLDRV
jgi:hypothetical protein